MAKKKKEERFICVTECFVNNHLFDPTEKLEPGVPRTYTRAKIGPFVPKHFRLIDENGAVLEDEQDAEERESKEREAAKDSEPAKASEPQEAEKEDDLL